MSEVGVVVQTSEIPVAAFVPYDTGNAFIVGEADWGPANTAVAINSLAEAAQIIGAPQVGAPNAARSTTNATLFDAIDTFFREGPISASCYISRVVGPSPVNASLVLLDGSSSQSLTVTASYPGVGGNSIHVAVAVSGPNFTITLSDANGNTLAVSPSLSSKAAAVTWFATTGYATATAGSGSTPASLSATPLTGGTDNMGSATITQWQAAINSFGAGLGPGQVLAPGQTNTTLSGIWSALGTHAQNNNRIALCDMDDNQSAATLVTDIGAFGTGSVASYCGFWAANLRIPGIVPATYRVISPSPVIAALCARADALGNPNLMAAGGNFPLQYVTGPNSIVSGSLSPYNDNDISTLNSAGINTFRNTFGQFENYGFVASIPQTSDLTYYQLNHGRLRMAIESDANVIGQPYVFSQLDGQGSDIAQFNSDLQAMLQGYYAEGALFGAAATDAFSVDTTTPNTPTTLSEGELNANLNVRMSPGAQLVQIGVNVVPVTQTV